MNTEDYLDRLTQKEINIFPIEEYINYKTYIQHSCFTGHTWLAKPEHILAGRGCPKCNIRKPTNFKTHEIYLKQLVNKNILIKPLQNYIRDNEKISHQCTKGHTWLVRPNDILKGRGCPECSSTAFNRKLPAMVYFISFVYESKIYYKLGITTKTPELRYGSEWVKLKMNLLWKIDSPSGEIAAKLEKELLRSNRANLININALRRGNSEVLHTVIDKPIL